VAVNVLAVLTVVPPAAAAASPCTQVVLPKPVGAIPIVTYPGLPIERTRTTFVPGPVTDDERVSVLLGADGTPTEVKVRQRLELSGTGDYSVRVRGPALRVTPLEDTVAPTIIRGAVVWQGFSPGGRLLAAELVLDPRREALILPLRVELAWVGTDGSAVEPGGVLPSGGRLTMRLLNQTVQPLELPVARGGTPATIAASLDTLLDYAEAPTGRSAPSVERDLPGVGGACKVGARLVETVAPMRVEGSVRIEGVDGVSVSGPGATALPAGDGAALSGVLSGSAEIALDVPAAGRLTIGLTMVTALDPRTLRPPAPAATWADWARARPSAASVQRALDTLIAAAAALARNDDKAPYLGHHGPGPTTTVFTYAVAPAPKAKRVAPPLRPRAVPIAATGLGLAFVTAAGVALWRRA
jgi:hypothetical protein